jgi:glycosyltransferase involved in cell wall biosynthesis
MMATGGMVVVVQNDGNFEYTKDGENCFVYESGNEKQALEAVQRIVGDAALREQISQNAIETAKRYEWKNIREDILDMYGIKSK